METVALLAQYLRAHIREVAEPDDGATAIEWAMFALLALAIAGAVAGAIYLAVTNKLPGIK